VSPGAQRVESLDVFRGMTVAGMLLVNDPGTWSAIYPLVLIVPLIITPVLRRFVVTPNRLLTTFLVTGTVVYLMVYVVMPRYTRLIKRWLFR